MLFFALVDRNARELYRDLSARGVAGDATVTDTGEHNSVSYTYLVNGAEYHAGSFSYEPNPDADRLRRGDRIRIVYDPDAPARSCACTPTLLVHTDNQPVLQAAVELLAFGGAFTSPAMVPLCVLIARRRGWSTLEWSELPIQVRAQVGPRHPGACEAFRPSGTGGYLVIAASTIGFHPDLARRPGNPPAGAVVGAVLHTRRVVVLVHGVLETYVLMLGNERYGCADTILVRLPRFWYIDDIRALLAAAGFEVLPVRRRRPLTSSPYELPATVRESLRTSPDLRP